jgi:bifunctional UDP-N-acetylglucosamine pyrophosphorylase / glucosamine-1-phosphate N-acetyltransferase
MAAGKGSRMNSELPKVLQLVNDLPMLYHIIRTARKLCAKQLIVVVGEYKDIIIEHLHKYTHTDDITFVMQHETLGTGHAVNCCISQLSNLESDDKIMILNGDSPLMQSHILMKLADITEYASIITTDVDNPKGIGRIKFKENNDLNRFDIIEEADCNEEDAKITTVSCGFYCIRNDILQKYLPQLTNDNAQKEYYMPQLISLINNKYPVCMTHIEKKDNWMTYSANTQEQLILLNKLFIQNILP